MFNYIFLLQNNTFSGLYLRQNLIVLEEVPSTNDYLKNLLSNIKPLPECTAIMAKHQTQGKGQRGNIWLTDSGKNLTCSVLLYPSDLSIDLAFNLNMLVCLAVQKWLDQYVQNVRIKWPNDLYIRDKKIGGILIENQLMQQRIKSSIIGIGININQDYFSGDLQKKATSLKIEDPKHTHQDITVYCISLLETIASYYQCIDLRQTQELLTQYNALLYRRDQLARYEVGGTAREGTIREVDTQGRLIIEFGSERETFDLKEIRFLPSEG